VGTNGSRGPREDLLLEVRAVFAKQNTLPISPLSLRISLLQRLRAGHHYSRKPCQARGDRVNYRVKIVSITIS